MPSTYSWESCEPYESIDRYEFTVRVEPVGDQASKVTWTARYEAPKIEAPQWDSFFAEEFRKSLTKLRSSAGRDEGLNRTVLKGCPLQNPFDEAVRKIGGEILAVRADVSKLADIECLSAETERRASGIDSLSTPASASFDHSRW